MFRTYQVLWNRLSQLIDAGNVFLSFILAWYIKFRSGWLPFGGHHSFSYYLPIMMAAVPVFLVSNWLVGLYKPLRSRSFWRVTSTILRSLVVGILLFMSFLYVTHVSQFSRVVLLVFAVLFMALSYVKHLGVLVVLRTMRARGYNKKYVVIVGWTAAAQRFVDNLEHHPWLGYHVLGYLGPKEETVNVPYLGSPVNIADCLEHNLVDNVLICLPREESSIVPMIIAECELVGVQSLIVPDYLDLLPATPRFENFAGMPLIDTRYVPLDDALNAFLKRAFDITLSVLVLLVLSPLYLVIAIAVRYSSPGPVIFKQTRVGRNRRRFTMYKFRTMHYDVNGTSEEEASWTTPADPRCTAVGSILRRTSLDELPQFWNVLRGNMSVIGPRPERPQFVDDFKTKVPRYMVKHRVRPGITGLAQVHGWRGDTSIDERIKYDIDYIENWSFWMDLQIIFRTLKDGLIHPNAY